MITSYRDFLVEARTTAQREHDISYRVWKESDPEYWEITDYKIVDGLINCDHSVDIPSIHYITKLPLCFGTVNGNFQINYNDNLTSLYGCPHIVTGSFCINNNPKLRSFEFFPKEIGKNVLMSDTAIAIENIENYPVTIIQGRIDKEGSFFRGIGDLIRSNQERFRPLLDDKVKFHQEIMRLKPEYIPLYTTIKAPEKKTII